MSHTPAIDKEGYLKDLASWNSAVAHALASSEGVDLTDAHWEIIHALRRFYAAHDLSPAMRPLVKWIRSELGDTKGNSIYLMELFPGSPAKLAAKIAGLPRPTNCL